MKQLIVKTLIAYFILFLLFIKADYPFDKSYNIHNMDIQSLSYVINQNNFNNSPILATGIIAGETIAGFTLAEVLITLLIIGVVASLVIPNLINDTQDQQYKVAWKKAYAEIDQDVRMLVNDNGGDLRGLFQGSSDKFNNVILTYINYTKKCTHYNTTDICWHNGQNLYRLDGNPENFWANDNVTGAILSNGTLLYIYYRADDCSHNAANRLTFGVCGQIMVDVNGFKAPNTIGKDVFGIWVKKNGIVPYGTIGDNWTDLTHNSTCSKSRSGWGCSAQYLYQ